MASVERIGPSWRSSANAEALGSAITPDGRYLLYLSMTSAPDEGASSGSRRPFLTRLRRNPCSDPSSASTEQAAELHQQRDVAGGAELP